MSARCELTVKVVQARGLKNTQILGSQDPFLRVWVTSARDSKRQTKAFGT